MFLAARRIQSVWRGHRIRRLWDQHWAAATTIQRWWRGLRMRRNLWHYVEQRLQEAVNKNFHVAATIIQSIFRGRFERRLVHDARGLINMQTKAAEELLHCLVDQMHHLNRTGMIPGVYSIRPSCLAKIEKLMITMAFRFLNGKAKTMVASKLALSEDHGRLFLSGRFYTQLPYPGPNFNELCPAQVEERIVNKNVDQRFFDVIAEYEASQQPDKFKEINRIKALRKRQDHLNKIKNRENHNTRHFCKDVVDSMSKWKIWTENNITIQDDIFKCPENVERFFKKVGHLFDDYKVNCYCTNLFSTT
ncbi:hypothetical protein KR009_004722, partial [Drosophila setifemur]